MDGNCNIITEIVLVISYTNDYCKKYIDKKLLVAIYRPTLILTYQMFCPVLKT